jgi:hypothetical protein
MNQKLFAGTANKNIELPYDEDEIARCLIAC